MTRPTGDFYRPGDWNAVCFRCGFKFKASELRKTWQGYWACNADWEPRQPQDFVHNVPDIQTPPWTQPEPPPIFVKVCFPNGRTALPSFAVPGCAMPDTIDPLFDPSINA